MAVMLGRALGEEAILLHVSEGRPPLDLLAALYEVSSPLREAGVVARLRTIQGKPAEQIVAEANRRRCRWVVMGTRGALDSPSSVAAAVMARSSVPVLAIRPIENHREFHRVYLWARPRSQAPWAWDVAGLLAGLLGTRVEHHLDPCNTEMDGCPEDALMILDVPRMPDPRVSATLRLERCPVLLVTRPGLGENAQGPV